MIPPLAFFLRAHANFARARAFATLSAAGLLGACGSNVTGTGGTGGSTGSAGGPPGTTSTSTGMATTSSSSTGTTMSTGTMASSTSSGTMTTSTSSSGTMTTSTSSSGAMTTSSSSSGEPDGGPTCPSLGDPCTECLSTSCASLYCSCYGNLACDELTQCVGGCATGDTTCLQTCLTAHKDGISAAYLLSNCSNQACVPACPNNGVMFNTCQVCLFSECVTEMNNCVADPECIPLIACWNGCAGSASCISQCSTTYAAGVNDGDAVAVCSGASCQGSCP
jgi:hypothetical protein